MRQTHNDNRYVPGDYWTYCAVCGFDYRRSELRKRWDGALVCTKDWEPEHPRRKRRRVSYERPFRRD